MSDNTGAVTRFYDQVRQGDIPSATEIFADELTWVEPPFPGHSGGTFRGKATILEQVLGPFVSTWSDLTVTPDRVIDGGADVVVLGRYAGKHKDTGRPFEARFTHSWTFTDGKATRFEMLADTVQFYRTVRPHGPGEVPVVGKTIEVDGVEIFYREAGPLGSPTLLLLHGFPSSSHMFRDLIPALADMYHVVAPDYPGFGLSGMPKPTEFSYTFDHLAETIARWTQAIGLSRYTLYMHDYGAPVGFRLATAHPDRVEGLVIQNGNIYMEGLSENLAPLNAYMSDPTPETEAPVRAMLSSGTTRFQYVHGVRRPEEIEPENWDYDQYFLDRPGNDQIQLALFRDYKTNPPLYPAWQEYLRSHRPPTLITWGANDPFFTASGAEAFLRDQPEANLHLLDTGHFALADHVVEIAGLMRSFLSKNVTR
jgi:pimeloyl-ACP methyl ester carboxylesterase/ketosteroid isomerase-like protein